MLHEPGSYVGEVVKLMSKKKILVKVQPEGKYVVDFDDKLIKLEDIKPNLRVALRNDTYALHKVRAHHALCRLMLLRRLVHERHVHDAGCAWYALVKWHAVVLTAR